MSWINDELPADWPSKGVEHPRDEYDLDFSTSQSSNSIVEPTVAIQAKTDGETPQWKEAIRPLEKRAEPPHLTGLFEMPDIDHASKEQGSHDDTSDFSTDSPSAQSTSEPVREPRGPIHRRLKVFGRPDTYTNERLGNLLFSMGGNDGSGTRLGGAGSTANESDMDLANNLQNEGRKVLQGLAPYRPNFSMVQESSLDELEQQLTSQGNTERSREGRGLTPQANDPSLAAIDTTTTESGSRTLDSLNSNMSNWDTLGGTHAAGFPALHKRSSRTLCGSGRTHKPENELSALAINEPIPPPQRHRQELQKTGDIATSEQPSTSGGESTSNNNIKRERHISENGRTNFGSRKSSSQFSGVFDMTPEPERFKDRAYYRSPLAARHGFLNEHIPSLVSRAASRREEPAQAIPMREKGHREESEDQSEDQQPNQFMENSIAGVDMSFSAAYERLANLLREKTSDRLSEVDSLDLSDCELESMVGLNKFVPQLTTLFANNNSIRSLQGLPSSVVHLDLSLNRMSPVSSFPASFISTLIISSNDLEDLRPLANLRALCSLDASDNKLQSLRGIRSLTALRSLNVSNNQLHELDLNLGMLVELDASHNQISAVNLETPLLESLDLEGNRVVALDEPMPNLRVLNIRSNNATVDFQGWSSLETLLFDGNKALQNLDAVAGNLATFSWEQPSMSERALKNDTTILRSVRDLKLGGLERGWQFGLDASLVYAVQHLDLAHCGIRELPPNLAQMFPFLTSLNLAFNKLDDRCLGCLQQCKKLERLSLFGNRLSIKGNALAAQLPQVRVLDSRQQRRKHQRLESGVYISDLYGEVMDCAENTVITVKNKALQWLDGHWTNYSDRVRKHTTRPGFQSPLYPISWEERQVSERTSVLDATTVDGTSLVGSVSATELLKALYVHHWQQLHGLVGSK